MIILFLLQVQGSAKDPSLAGHSKSGHSSSSPLNISKQIIYLSSYSMVYALHMSVHLPVVLLGSLRDKRDTFSSPLSNIFFFFLYRFLILPFSYIFFFSSFLLSLYIFISSLSLSSLSLSLFLFSFYISLPVLSISVFFLPCFLSLSLLYLFLSTHSFLLSLSFYLSI